MDRNFLLRMLEMLTGGYNREDVQNVRHGRAPTTNIGKLLSIPSWGFNLVHEHAEKVLLWDNLDNAQGNALDRYGANFGIAREGLDDDYLRLLIKVKMIAQLSGGDIDTLISAAAELMGVDPDQVELDEVFPAKVWIYVDEIILDEYHMQIIDLIARVMKRIVAAGVGMRLFLRVKHEFFSKIYVCPGVSTYIRSIVNLASQEDQASWMNSTTP
ncbi:MAG: hypothetical protein FWD51_01340 [Betaproteobacteria bacterium]|nr:hypothetical protein [Betaproteobacteria bacterium]